MKIRNSSEIRKNGISDKEQVLITTIHSIEYKRGDVVRKQNFKSKTPTWEYVPEELPLFLILLTLLGSDGLL